MHGARQATASIGRQHRSFARPGALQASGGQATARGGPAAAHALTLPACFSPVSAVILMPGCRAQRRATSAPVYPEAPSTATLATSVTFEADAAWAGAACTQGGQGHNAGSALQMVVTVGRQSTLAFRPQPAIHVVCILADREHHWQSTVWASQQLGLLGVSL